MNPEMISKDVQHAVVVAFKLETHQELADLPLVQAAYMAVAASRPVILAPL